MLSPLGKALRKYRIDEGLLLKEMAEGVDMPSSYLSAIETGRKQAPDNFIARLQRWRPMPPALVAELQRYLDVSRNEFKITLGTGAHNSMRETAAVLARSFNTLSEEDLIAIQKLFDKGN